MSDPVTAPLRIKGDQGLGVIWFWLVTGGAKPPETPTPLNGRPQHLIEVAKRGRLDQILLFSALLTIRRTTAERRLTAVHAVRPPSAATQGKNVQGVTFLSA